MGGRRLVLRAFSIIAVFPLALASCVISERDSGDGRAMRGGGFRRTADGAWEVAIPLCGHRLVGVEMRWWEESGEFADGDVLYRAEGSATAEDVLVFRVGQAPSGLEPIEARADQAFFEQGNPDWLLGYEIDDVGEARLTVLPSPEQFSSTERFTGPDFWWSSTGMKYLHEPMPMDVAISRFCHGNP